MKQIERTKTITYRWWRYDEYGIKQKDVIDSETETIKNCIIQEHIEALEESAEDRIFEMITRGFTCGELHDNIHMIDDDPIDGVEYSGWWEVSTDAKDS
jgi:hypothetical protein